jgi:hypothetical protein
MEDRSQSEHKNSKMAEMKEDDNDRQERIQQYNTREWWLQSQVWRLLGTISKNGNVHGLSSDNSIEALTYLTFIGN